MIIVWELPDKSLALTKIIGNTDVNDEINKISAERSELTYKFTLDSDKTTNAALGEFFKAIELDENNEFIHNMVKAREIWRNKIRRDRYKKLLELDVEYQRALETNDLTKMTEVASQKQVLRDAPNNPLIEAANTITELKEVYPDLLK